jgi:hypothetical protein
MRLTNYWTGVVIIIGTAVALAALLAGNRSVDSQIPSATQAAVSEPTIATDGLPEVVVTAQRIRPETIALSERDAEVERDKTSLRSHHR